MLYLAVAVRSFRRFSTYRAATLAGVFTNSVFGVIYSYAYLALWHQRPDAGGYDATDAVTYVWLGQALLMTVALWGGGTTDDLADRIRTGDVAIDLYRPVGLIGWYLAGDLGRAAYHVLARGVLPTVFGLVLFDIALPVTPVAALGFVLSLVLAVVTSFGIRFLVACSAFWVLDQTGLRMLSGVLAIFLSGMTLPLVIFPEPLRSIALALPWASYLQTPADIWLGHRSGWRSSKVLPCRPSGWWRCWGSATSSSVPRRGRWCSRVAEVSTSSAREYVWIARMWVRSALAYPMSFWTLTIGSALITLLDFVGLGLMFHSIPALGGFSLREVALLYGASGIGIGVADLLIGSVEQVGQHVRTGTLDAMLTRPVPLLVQVCADRFAVRRLGRISQALAVFGYGAWWVDWTLPKVALAVLMVVSASLIFFSLFVAFSCIQFWTVDSTEFANAFTYGGNTMTQYPMTIFPREVLKALTFVVPLAFVNWYPCLYLLDRPDPFGLPSWFSALSPLAAVLSLAIAALAWRSGVRHYTSTGS